MQPCFRRLLAILCSLGFATTARPALADPDRQATFDPAAFVSDYCMDCHSGKDAEAHLDLAPFQIDKKGADARMADKAFQWITISQRVMDGSMPPEDSEAPSIADRERFTDWVQTTLQRTACEQGVSPGRAPMRRLTRSEYSATLRDLLSIHINAGQDLPVEGAGGEGFDNAAETLFLSPLHAEKFFDAARVGLNYALASPRSRRQVLGAEPDANLSPHDAAKKQLQSFLPRAFRRPVTDTEQQAYQQLFADLFDVTKAYEVAMQQTLEAVLMSPNFLFRLEPTHDSPDPKPLDDHALAVRLSYFLWGTMPDQQLMQLANQGKLSDPEVLRQQTLRLLQHQERVRLFAKSFTEQWLGTRTLGREFKPDARVIKQFDAELLGGMKYEPIFFFQELLTENHSILTLIDSDFTYANRRLAQHYKIPGSFREQPRRVELPEDSPRGGLLGMASVLAVSSHPYRTTPVLRGKWVLETMLGTPPPPAPPDVPALDEVETSASAETLRQRLERHRRDPVCASCHDRIDPLGFGLENFDVLGRWRTSDQGQAIDSRGTLPDGTHFEGPQELKHLLLERKSQFARNLTAKLMGYALGRGLTFKDYCTVSEIVEKLEADEFRSHTLILEIVQSVPFRYHAGTDPAQTVTTVE